MEHESARGSTPPSWRVLPLPRWVLGAVRARTRDCDAWIRLFVGHTFTFTVQVLHKQSHPGVRSHRPAAGQLSRRSWCRLPSSSLLHSATLGKRVFTTLHGSAVSPSTVSPRHLRRTGWLKPAGFWHFLQASRARSMGDRDSSKKAAAPGVRCGCCPNPLIYSQFMGRSGHRACIIGQFASSFRNPIGQLVSFPACVFLLLS